MACLYCGKDIGPFRMLRDREFCSNAHRQNYRKRLGKALDRISAPTPIPAETAGFQLNFPIQEGNHTYIPAGGHMGLTGYTLRNAEASPVAVASRMGDDPELGYLRSGVAAAPARLRMPRFELAAQGGIRDVDEAPSGAAPPMCARGMVAENPEAAECFVAPALAEAMWSAVRTPRFELTADVELRTSQEPAAEATPAPCTAWMPAGNPEAVERFIGPSMAALMHPAAALEMLRFELAAEGEISRPPNAPEEPVPALSTSWVASANADPAERLLIPALAELMQPAAGLQTPRFEVPAGTGRSLPRFAGPVAALAAEPVERFILSAAAADALPFAVDERLPLIQAVAPAGPYVRAGNGPVAIPAAEPVTVHVAAVMDSRPVARAFEPVMQRFNLHAVEDLANAQAAEPVPEMAPLMASPAPVPVESMPAIAAFVPAAVAPAPALRLPEVGPLAQRPMPLARPVRATAGPLAPAAVETMPAVPAVVPQPVALRVGLRRPMMARLQPAQESSDALAAPVPAAAPQAVESLPTVQAFAAVPLPPPVQLLLRQPAAGLTAVGRPAELALASFHATTAPAAAGPELQAAGTTAIEPISRVARSAAGSQPERPRPQVPQPGPIPLEYYCQRIAGAPVQNIAWINSPVSLMQHAFEMKPALRPFAEYAGKSRKLLPFEEIFASQTKEGEPRRVKLGYAGKIAATIMVGVALWTGTRLANLSGSAAALRARVASSERTVTASAEVRQNQGSGTMAALRRAIANRAATEITDTFDSMEAWGSAGKTWAAGWQHSPDGYVRTGEMALFRPSLQYTDYHVEFYGQIEQKSMGWAVRAKDKKNYYAMKFTVIEPGLRPIIAMQHYQVVNGKRGKVTQTPLNIMIHNNEPYHVAVDVRGNRFVAAIEGERVDSWTDDAPAKGGIAFFSEAGERARLYWMKVSRNQDWLGRFCAYLSEGSNGGAQQTAEVWSPGVPRNKPEPANPHLPDVALTVAGESQDDIFSPNRARTLKQQRSETWIS